MKKFEEIFFEFIDYKKMQVKESTIANYLSIYKSHFNFLLSVNRFDRDYIRKWLFTDAMRKKLSAKTQYDIITLLNSVFKFAKEQGYIEKEMKLPKPAESIKSIKVFSYEEISHLREYIVAHMSFVNLGILICLYTGLRIGEVCALCWKDIDLNSNTILISKTLQRLQINEREKIKAKKTKLIISEPKTQHSNRTIPIPFVLLPYLKKYRGKPNWFVLSASERSIEPRTLQRRYKAILKDAGIAYKNFHVLRHSFATNANAKGMDCKTLSEILGHKNVGFTLKQYVHPSLEQKREQINAIYRA